LRESRGTGDVVENKRGFFRAFENWLIISGEGQGTMANAIRRGREDAMKPVRKSGGKSGGGKKKVRKKVSGTSNQNRKTRGVRKVVNRNKGAKARKK